MNKNIVTIKCSCGNEWDFKSPITLIQTRIVFPSPTVSIDLIKAEPEQGEKG